MPDADTIYGACNPKRDKASKEDVSDEDLYETS